MTAAVTSPDGRRIIDLAPVLRAVHAYRHDALARAARALDAAQDEADAALRQAAAVPRWRLVTARLRVWSRTRAAEARRFRREYLSALSDLETWACEHGVNLVWVQELSRLGEDIATWIAVEAVHAALVTAERRKLERAHARTERLRSLHLYALARRWDVLAARHRGEAERLRRLTLAEFAARP